METVKEIFQSIYDSYRDRIKSPLVGSFIVTYLIFNWRLVAILFYSEWAIHCRIEWIEENYCNWYNYTIPFGIALFYVLVLPYINLVFDFLLTKYSDTQLEKKNKSRTRELNQKKHEAKLLREIADEQAGTSEVNRLKDEIEILQKERDLLIDKNKLDSERWSKQISDSNEKEKKLNQLISARDKVIDEYENKNINLSDYEWALTDPINKDIDVKNLNSVILLSKDMPDFEKENFINIVEILENKGNISDLKSINLFEKIGLIISSNKSNLLRPKLTNFGELYYKYLKRGRDMK